MFEFNLYLSADSLPSLSEEGARFPIVTMGSAVWAGIVQLDMAWNCTEVTKLADGALAPQTTKQELQRIGYLGDTEASYEALRLAAHFELHIEQGPILETEQRKIGAVTGGQACHWFEVEVRGRDSHAGTTPMAARMDALLAAAKMTVVANTVAKDEGGVITVGRLHALPGSVNTVAHTVLFTLDVRHPQDAAVERMVARCRDAFDAIAKVDSELGVQVGWTTLAENAAVRFDEGCVRAVKEAAEATCAELPEAECKKIDQMWRYMTSGATHDSCNVSRHCPTAMIFTPTKGGLSHTPVEYCSPEDCILGTQVLLGAVMRYDAERV